MTSQGAGSDEPGGGLPATAPKPAPDIVDALPVQPAAVKAQMLFSGPIPPPGILQAYEKTLTGASDRILKIWESEVAHRQSEERHNNDHVRREDAAHGAHHRWMPKAKLVFAGFMFVFFTVVGVGLLVNGYKTEGYAVFLTPILGAVLKYCLDRFDDKKGEGPADPPPTAEKK